MLIGICKIVDVGGELVTITFRSGVLSPGGGGGVLSIFSMYIQYKSRLSS